MNFAGKILIAMPQLEDPNFAGTVVYIINQDDKGVSGLVINRPLDMPLNRILEKFDYKPIFEDPPVYWGGPVQSEQGIVLHSSEQTWDITHTADRYVNYTLSTDVLQAVSEGVGPRKYLACVGYSGWDPGQLEAEIANDAWLVGKSSYKLLFDTPADQKYDEALRSLGLEPLIFKSTGGNVGHA